MVAQGRACPFFEALKCGYQWAYIFFAVRPDTGDDVTLVMASVNAKVMDLFLAHFVDTLGHAAHAVMMCVRSRLARRARPHSPAAHVTSAPLPPSSPELNPVERLRLRPTAMMTAAYRAASSSDTEAIIAACWQAWIDLFAEPDRMRSPLRQSLCIM